MITAKQLLAKGWNRKHTPSQQLPFQYLWTHPKCWMKDVMGGEVVVITHTLAQARWAQEHILEKQK